MNIDFIEMMLASLEEAVTQLDGAIVTRNVTSVHDLKTLILDLQMKINSALIEK